MIGSTAGQYEAPVAITAIDIAALVDLQPDARVAERGAAGQIARPVAGDAGMGDAGGFRRGLHERVISNGFQRFQPSPGTCFSLHVWPAAPLRFAKWLLKQVQHDGLRGAAQRPNARNR